MMLRRRSLVGRALRQRPISDMPRETEFSKGIQTIERAITEGVTKIGRRLTSADFTWHHGRVAPDMTDLEVRIGRRAVVGIFGRAEIEDSADRADFAETLQTVQRIIAEAAQLPR
jgi:hypothetical protein